jgi:hypothetical protein
MLSVSRPRASVRSQDTEHCRKRSAEARQDSGESGAESRSIDRAPSPRVQRDRSQPSQLRKPTGASGRQLAGGNGLWAGAKTLRLRPRLLPHHAICNRAMEQGVGGKQREGMHRQ